MEVACQCGSAKLQLSGEPRLRILCHCTICQRFNRAEKADIAIFRRDEAVLTQESAVEFQRCASQLAVSRKILPALRR